MNHKTISIEHHRRYNDHKYQQDELDAGLVLLLGQHHSDLEARLEVKLLHSRSDFPRFSHSFHIGRNLLEHELGHQSNRLITIGV